ncbi:methyltransferase domain-containing protein [Thermomonospora cellulosilytica]|uniref:Protein-L-isoaspartate O-methyltransferase n=1 Tax=Thermomonospora cellulosilytica TaxID=1411118 RepID=A0A7W3MTQ3_9ACTN|nr:methyltransferase domain-containing protein [Thermomonospora cellulosilytica]MBA9001737.1 protein-L-isoaspartate(D-aspartate) O-methyltransferase [Thermomonospora cellulosilytica]
MIAPDPRAAIDALADAADATPAWRDAMHRAPRHAFVPDRILAGPASGPDRLIDKAADPDGWWQAVYSDQPIVTQVDDGTTDLPDGRDYTSSCSQPSLVVSFLRLLEVHDHHRVLEIGTGTGWTAGLLSAAIGDHNVTSIEVDPVLAERATANLEGVGLHPNLIVGDGAAGHPDTVPFDRVHVTCGVRSVPYAWVEQTRPGGIIVLPWSPGIGWGHQLVLHVQPDGTALGRVGDSADYMLLRAQRRDLYFGGEHEETTTRIDPRTLAWAPRGADLAMAALLPGVRAFERELQDDVIDWWLSDPGSRSWAVARYVPGETEYPVRQHGPRRLWEEAEDAYFRWQSWGRPGCDRYGITVSADGFHLWMDGPAHRIA